MRFSVLSTLTALVAMASAAAPVPVEKRQYSACVQECLERTDVWDGKAVYFCRQDCGEVKMKRVPVPAPVAAPAVEKRQLSACVVACMDDLGIYDGHAISQCRRTCGERP
ncbi:hypothetical protein C8034_v001346 [Colletotrichum sidae]|uniref:Uncharacterized protein n=3 Tax=Colletotrichum orbiculare species complex TaxID=2707354 RepID=N4VHK0_COLOR|nr:hypothetical protein Cob_v010326 [Colletotrichum orbiculare MAFF 240422]TDZ30413.1 hypothetical protein C8035_v002500 [Colletotrichum spinosum]TEA16425.1 hypothetical protein C8034_v001346 [Colletotrichum sidae]